MEIVEIRASGNDISSISPKAFLPRATKLTLVDISNNELTEVRKPFDEEQ